MKLEFYRKFQSFIQFSSDTLFRFLSWLSVSVADWQLLSVSVAECHHLSSHWSTYFEDSKVQQLGQSLVAWLCSSGTGVYNSETSMAFVISISPVAISVFILVCYLRDHDQHLLIMIMLIKKSSNFFIFKIGVDYFSLNCILVGL